MTDLVSNQRKHDVAFHRDGRIDICHRAAKALDLHKGDVIGVAVQDMEYILHVRARAGEYEGRYAGMVYPTKVGKRYYNNFRASSVELTKAVMKACGKTGSNCVRLYCGDTVQTDHGLGLCLITRNPL